MIAFDRVSLRYGTSAAAALALRDVSFAMPAGGFRWLIGASGAGKSSLLRILRLATRPSSGLARIMGADVGTLPRAEIPAMRRRIGVVFQDFRLLPHLSLFDNVALPLRLAGRPEGELRADVAELLRWVGLFDRRLSRPGALSGGEQQRAAIARAVVARPRLLLADEPTGNLDEVQANRLIALLGELNRLGTTIVIATHDLALAAQLPAPHLELERGCLITR